MDKTDQKVRHLTNDQFRSGLTEAQLSHIAACTGCADLFAEYMESESLLTAPMDLRESVLRRSRQIDVQMIAKTNQASRQLQLFYYSLRVGFAVLGALVLLALTPYSLEHIPQRGSSRWQPEHTWNFHLSSPDISLNLDDILKWR